jgi:hypothetical protein
MDDETRTNIAKLVRWYLKHIRPHAESEMQGIFRQIYRMTQKGVSLAQISRAIQNYAADDWVKRCDPRSRHHIGKFMTATKITQWQTPVKKPEAAPVEASLAALDRMAELQLRPKPRQALPVSEDDVEETGEMVEL